MGWCRLEEWCVVLAGRGSLVGESGDGLRSGEVGRGGERKRGR